LEHSFLLQELDQGVNTFVQGGNVCLCDHYHRSHEEREQHACPYSFRHEPQGSEQHEDEGVKHSRRPPVTQGIAPQDRQQTDPAVQFLQEQPGFRIAQFTDHDALLQSDISQVEST
jgi:hypothetical protein